MEPPTPKPERIKPHTSTATQDETTGYHIERSPSAANREEVHTKSREELTHHN